MALPIPKDLGSLKRPALQKLCKSLGLKANGKNVNMVRMLEEYRERSALSPPSMEKSSSCGDEEEEKEEKEMEPVVEKMDEERKEEGREEDKEEELVEGRGRREVEEDEEEEKCEIYQILPLQPSSPLQLCNNPQSTEEEQPEPPISPPAIKNRRATFSISPQQPQNPDTVTMTTVPPPMVATPTAGSSRKRRRTHTLSPSSSVLLQSGTISLASDGTLSSDNGVTIGGPSEEAPPTDYREEEEEEEEEEERGVTGGTGSTRDEIMALLEQRMAEKKATLGYKSQESTVESIMEGHRVQAASKIPVSKTMDKLNKAHEKLFNRMPSILEYSEKKEKKRKVLTTQNTTTPGPPAKRQKLVPKTPITPYQPPKKLQKCSTINKSVYKSVSRTTTKSGLVPPPPPPSGGSSGAPYTHPNINFTSSIGFDSTDDNREAGSTGPAFTFSAAKPTGTSQTKKHRGKLPDFKFSIY